MNRRVRRPDRVPSGKVGEGGGHSLKKSEKMEIKLKYRCNYASYKKFLDSKTFQSWKLFLHILSSNLETWVEKTNLRYIRLIRGFLAILATV